ncbi:MAG: hypothetical protein MJ174_10055 [Treponema sp.]|nr:hypothetical protein [Treponema sp.]
MKKKVYIFIFFCLTINLFAKEQIGECKKNVYKVGIIQNNVPVCFYYEDVQGLISVIKKFYIRIGTDDFGPYDSINSWLFASDKIIYTALVDDELCLFVNGKCLEHYKNMSNFFIANDNESLVYAYESDSGVYIKSKKELGPFQQIKYFLVDNDRIISYVVRENSKLYIYTEQNKYGPFDDVTDWIYQKNNNYAYKVRNNKKEYIYDKNGLLAGPFDSLELKAFSSNGTQLAYVTTKADKKTKAIPAITSTLWVNKEKINEGWIILNVGFADESLFYTINTQQEGNYIYFANKKKGPYIQIGDLEISPNKKTLAFSYSYDYSPGEEYYLSVRNEQAGPYESISNITFSEDGNNIAYVVQKNNEKYLINKQNQFGPYENISNITFSEDGNLLSYVSSDGYYNNYILHTNNFNTKKYSFITDVKFYKDILTFTVKMNGLYYNMLIYHNTEFIGNYINNKFIYIDDGIIYVE